MKAMLVVTLAILAGMFITVAVAQASGKPVAAMYPGIPDAKVKIISVRRAGVESWYIRPNPTGGEMCLRADAGFDCFDVHEVPERCRK